MNPVHSDMERPMASQQFDENGFVCDTVTIWQCNRSVFLMPLVQMVTMTNRKPIEVFAMHVQCPTSQETVRGIHVT